MKKILFTILMMAILPIFGNSQDEGPIKVYNFIYNKGDIYWFKVYHIDSTIAARHFKCHPFVNYENNLYQCSVTLQNYVNKKSSAWILNNDCVINFILELKDNRYRVTVTNIVWKTTIGGGIFIEGGGAGMSTTQSANLKTYAFTKKGKRKWEPGEELPQQLDFALQALFNATESTQAKIIKEDF